MNAFIAGLGNNAPALSTSMAMPLSAANKPGMTSGGVDFQQVLFNSLENVNQMDRDSQAAIAGGLLGQDVTQAEIFTSVKKADLAFRTMMQIRNKLMDAYNEIKQMRM